MYTGTNKTALGSQQKLADALQRIMAKKPYHSISVSEICREAEVSRQTYYTLFNSKESIISYILNKCNSSSNHDELSWKCYSMLDHCVD